jgi:hypothetical protein
MVSSILLCRVYETSSHTRNVNGGIEARFAAGGMVKRSKWSSRARLDEPMAA